MPPSANIEINGVATSDDDVPIDTLVQLSNADTGGEVTYLWTVLDQPEGAADALSATNIENPTITPKKEGTYLLQLIINQGLSDERVDSKIFAVRQLKSFQRIPAAAETIETGATGWKNAANRNLQKLDDLYGDGNIIACGNSSGGNLSAGTIVFFLEESTIKTGLPGEEHALFVNKALATTAYKVAGTLGVVIGGADGGAFSTSKVGLVRVFGLVENSYDFGAGAPAANDPIYVDDTGQPSLDPGTFRRRIGRVMSAAGTVVRWIVEGHRGAGQGVRPIHRHMLGARFDPAEWGIGGGYIVSSAGGTASASMDLPVERGAVITGVEYEFYGDGAADITAVRCYSVKAGTVTQIGGDTQANPPNSWDIASLGGPFTPTEAEENMSFHLLFAVNADNIRFANVTYFVIDQADRTS